MDSVQDWIRNRTDALQERLGFGEDPEAVENQSLLSQFNEARLAAVADLFPPRLLQGQQPLAPRSRPD
jgi:hypothetical protein